MPLYPTLEDMQVDQLGQVSNQKWIWCKTSRLLWKCQLYFVSAYVGSSNSHARSCAEPASADGWGRSFRSTTTTTRSSLPLPHRLHGHVTHGVGTGDRDCDCAPSSTGNIRFPRLPGSDYIIIVFDDFRRDKEVIQTFRLPTFLSETSKAWKGLRSKMASDRWFCAKTLKERSDWAWNKSAR